jgi:hypothetical protein
MASADEVLRGLCKTMAEQGARIAELEKRRPAPLAIRDWILAAAVLCAGVGVLILAIRAPALVPEIVKAFCGMFGRGG